MKPCVLPYNGISPILGKNVFLANNATLVGDVVLEDDVNIWFCAVLRADIGQIRIGKRTNIQDLVCIHMTDGVSNTIIGSDVTVGHSAVVHGASIGDGCLIGMGSILLDNVEIGSQSVIAAGSLVTPRTVIPPRSFVMGRPARVLRQVSEEEARWGIEGAEHYLQNVTRFAQKVSS